MAKLDFTYLDLTDECYLSNQDQILNNVNTRVNAIAEFTVSQPLEENPSFVIANVLLSTDDGLSRLPTSFTANDRLEYILGIYTASNPNQRMLMQFNIGSLNGSNPIYVEDSSDR